METWRSCIGNAEEWDWTAETHDHFVNGKLIWYCTSNFFQVPCLYPNHSTDSISRQEQNNECCRINAARTAPQKVANTCEMSKDTGPNVHEYITACKSSTEPPGERSYSTKTRVIPIAICEFLCSSYSEASGSSGKWGAGRSRRVWKRSVTVVDDTGLSVSSPSIWLVFFGTVYRIVKLFLLVKLLVQLLSTKALA